MDAREEQAREILKEWNINPDQYWPKEAFSSENRTIKPVPQTWLIASKSF